MALNKIWKLKDADENAINHIHQELKVHPAICRLLALRGITDYHAAKSFFRPAPEHLHNPFLMQGMEEVVVRVTEAKKRHEKIMVYGDYDVDGTTAVAVVYDFLCRYYGEDLVSFYIPHRYREGYGISFAGIDKAAAANCSIIIALDCGIKAVEKAAYAKSKNIDLIICDHHLPGDTLPGAFAILNPKQKDCSYPFKELSGCGIGFKLITALAREWQLDDESWQQYLDLVAVSIAADIVPMTDENRVLAYYGLKKANEQPCTAIKALKEIAAVKRDMTIADLVFIIAPRINAAGRMDDARKAVELFIEQDETKAKVLAEVLHTDNHERRATDREMTDEALAILQEETEKKYTTVLYRPHWHKGVVGIVASRLIEHYYRPTIVLTESNGKITGSARSVNGFNIYDAIHDCNDLLENYGGHNFAAGITLHPDKLEVFRNRFEAIVRERILPESLQPHIEIDAVIPLSAITTSFYSIIGQMEPFGPDNLRPVFISEGVSDPKGYSRIVKENHIKFVIQQNDSFMSGIGFNLAEKFGIMKNGQPFDIVYTIDENEWNGNTTLQLKVIDICPHTS